MERHKNTSEYLRHFTTLSTGSILLLATFLEKIIKMPKGIGLITVAIICFLLSILGAMISYTISLVQSNRINEANKNWENALAGFGILFTWIGFFVGIVSIGIFIIMNFS